MKLLFIVYKNFLCAVSLPFIIKLLGAAHFEELIYLIIEISSGSFEIN